jgi:hypothetical protein
MTFLGKRLGLITVLEKVSDAFMTPVEILAVTGEETLHERGQISIRATDQKVKVIGHKRPGHDVDIPPDKVFFQTGQE